MRKRNNKPDKSKLEETIKKYECREKQCEYFDEGGAWTFCKALFTEKSCTYKEGDEYISYDD